MQDFQQYFQKLERELKYRNYSSKTIKSYTTCIKYFLQKIDENPENIDRENIIDFLLFLQEKKKAPKTINLYKEVIKFFYREVLKIEKDIDIKFSRESKKLPIILTKNEIQKIIEITKNYKHKFILQIA